MYLEGGRKEEEETQTGQGVLCARLSFTENDLLNHRRQCSSPLHPLFLQLEKEKKGTVIILFFLNCCKD